jgi:hypothetical protein
MMWCIYLQEHQTIFELVILSLHKTERFIANPSTGLERASVLPGRVRLGTFAARFSLISAASEVRVGKRTLCYLEFFGDGEAEGGGGGENLGQGSPGGEA